MTHPFYDTSEHVKRPTRRHLRRRRRRYQRDQDRLRSTAAVNSAVRALPPISGVRTHATWRPRPSPPHGPDRAGASACSSIMATRQDRARGVGDTVAGEVGRRAVDGLVQRGPSPARPRAGAPSDPATTPASSLRMSPNRLSVSSTSKRCGACSSSKPPRPRSGARASTSGYSRGDPRHHAAATGARPRARSPCRPR